MQSGEKKLLPIHECAEYLELLKLSDANLQTDDGSNFDIHRFALARSSQYFKRLFLGMDDDENRRKFHIPGISGECLSDILCYIYAGDVRVSESNVADLIIGADYLLLDDLKMKMRGNIEDNLTEGNCLRIFHAAHLIDAKDMFQKCFRFIQIRFKVIMRCEENGLTGLPLDILRRILSHRNLFVHDEAIVWRAIVKWTQKDIPLRMSDVPKLLLTLAMEDVGEELATEILQHEIVSENSFMEDLVEIRSSNESPTNLDVLSTLFRSYSDRFTEPILRHRIPLQLFVAWSYDGGEMNLYVTCDENTDLWRKITELRVWPDALIVIGHNMYIFDMEKRLSMNFDLSVMNWGRMLSCLACIEADELCVVAIGAYIYVIGEMDFVGSYCIEIYDTENDEWWEGDNPLRVSDVAAVAIENKIYAVGKSSSDAMMTQMFDTDTDRWSVLSPPTVHHTEFSLVAYHGKMYLIGNSDAEVFSPATNLWRKLPGGSRKRSSPKAKVINDLIVVTDGKGYYEYWNNEKECFEELVEKDIFDGLPSRFSRFCTVDDTDTIRLITRQNRDPEMTNNYMNRKKRW